MRVEARHVEPDELADFMSAARADPSIAGLCVTMPHKRAIRPLLDGETQAARAAGSVNAARRQEAGFVGAQFDGIALREALLAAGVSAAGASVWLVGLGGAGVAIALALQDAGCRRLYVTDTDRPRLGTVLPLLGAETEVVEDDARPQAEILVNATPLGMRPGDPSPFPLSAVVRAAVVADIVADPNETRLAALTRAAGTPLVTGRAMVEHQIAPIGHWLLSADLPQAG